mgnify:CR=1 FL=1
MTSSAPKRWAAVFRVLERDERVFAVLLALVMGGGLAAIGLIPPLRRRHEIDLFWLVTWFVAYKAGVFALVTLRPRATRGIFLAALGVDLLLVFALLWLTGGGESLFYLLFSRSWPSTPTTLARRLASGRRCSRARSMPSRLTSRLPGSD